MNRNKDRLLLKIEITLQVQKSSFFVQFLGLAGFIFI